MAVPTRRRGHAKQGQVRQHTKLSAVNTVTCPNCGFYNGKKVKDVKVSEAE